MIPMKCQALFSLSNLIWVFAGHTCNLVQNDVPSIPTPSPTSKNHKRQSTVQVKCQVLFSWRNTNTCILFTLSIQTESFAANGADPDQSPHSGLHFLPVRQQFCETSTSSLLDLLKLWDIYIKELTFTTLSANSADDKLMIFFLIFFPENRKWMETICMKCQILFLIKIKKILQIVIAGKLSLLKILPRVLSDKVSQECSKYSIIHWLSALFPLESANG